MQNRIHNTFQGRRANHTITAIFVFLIFSLQFLMWGHWEKILEPRLKRDAESQANVLAHSQAIKLAAVVVDEQVDKTDLLLQETINEILLFTDPDMGNSIFAGIGLEVDYSVVPVTYGSLDRRMNPEQCIDCFISEVALYSPVSDELVGIARFAVSDHLFQRLRNDVRKTLIIQSLIGAVLLLLVFGIVIILIREINRSHQQAEAASKAKSSFLTHMSHELRTPLNSIIGFSELMNLDPGFPEQYRKNLSTINKSGEHLLELINEVLELSRIEAGQSNLVETTFDLSIALQQIAEMIRPRLKRKSLLFTFEMADELPKYIKTDERKLRQILLNLLGNAVKLTNEGGVSLRVKIKDQDSTSSEYLELLFEVEDSGPGISAADQETLFDAFSQTREGYDKKEGAGLGLAISRQFVYQLGGNISLSSIVGSGTVFSFSIKVKAESSLASPDPKTICRVIGLLTKTDKLGAPWRILVVDDNPENRRLLCSILENAGFSVRTAKDGKMALATTLDWSPHLIWMDMRMPVMDGYEATSTIREYQQEQGYGKMEPIIIALTASAFNEDREKVLDAGCNDFVRRPYRQSEIFEMINKHLGVEFIFDDIKKKDHSSPEILIIRSEKIQKEELLALPQEIIEALQESIELSDILKMNEAVDAIRDVNKVLADEISQSVNSFQYDRILEMIDRSQ